MSLRAALRLVATTAAGTLLVTTGISAGPVAATEHEEGVEEVLGFLGGGPDTLASWTSALSRVGMLAEPLPLVNASPGALLGLDDLVQKAVHDELASALTWPDLETERTFDLGDGREAVLVTDVVTTGAAKRLEIDVELSTLATGQSLALTSSNPAVDLTISDGVSVAVDAQLSLDVVWPGPGENVYLLADDATPRLDVDASASVDGAAAKAAVGILGVALDGSTLDLSAHLKALVDDPDNDGRLAFDESGTGDGELAAAGSLEGLLDVGFDHDSPGPGSVNATFELGAAATAVPGLDLPTGIASTVTVSWPDISTGSPSVSATGLQEAVGKFQNMSLRDLADGLAQVVTSLTAMQKAKFDGDGAGPATDLVGDLDLPFMKGTVSDAVKANQALVDFLEQWVHQAPDPGEAIPPGYDPAKVGQPKFASLQELLAALEEHANIDLGVLDWDETDSKLVLDLTLSEDAPATPQPLDELSVKASGPGATYSASGLAVTTSPWTENQWAGMRIVAGNSAGEIVSNTASSLTLKAPWIGGRPADTTPFVIVGPQPHIGAVTFANRIDDGGHGIVNANADQTFAEVTPSYTTTLTLVLDLQDPKTGDDCIGFEGNTQPCPFIKSDGPFNTEVESLPLNVDRLMIRTGDPLVEADFPIGTQVDLTANAGYFKVRLLGGLDVCASGLDADCETGTPDGPMISIGLKQLGDADGDIRFGELFSYFVQDDGDARDPSDLLDVDVNVQAQGEVEVSIPEAADFLPGGATASMSVSWNDLTQTTGPDGPQLDTSDLEEIFELDFDADDPQALFAIVIKTLQTLSQQLAEANPGAGAGVFDEDIPGVGRSLRDLLRSDESNQGTGVTYGPSILTDASRTFGDEHVGRAVIVGTQVALVQEVQAGDSHTLVLTAPWTTQPPAGTAYMFRSPLDDAVDLLLASPPDSFQDLVEVLNERLGTETLSFRYLDTGGTPNLVLDLDWDRTYETAAPIRLDLGTVAGAERTFAGAQASGNATVGVSGNVDVGLVVPLAAGDGPSDAASLKVLEDSSIDIHADASFTGYVQGVIGPLSLSLGQPGGPAETQAQARGNISLDLATAGATADNPVSFSAFLSGVDATFNATNSPVDCGETLDTPLMVCGELPLYVNAAGAAGTWTEAGTISLRLPDTDQVSDLTTLTGDLPADAGVKRLDVPADLADRLLNAVLDFNNLGTGLDGYLVMIEQAFRLAAFDGRLPLIGEDLQQGADFLGNLRTTLEDSIWSELPGGGRPLDSSEVTTFINDNLEQVLDDAGMTAADLEVGFECTATLATVGAPTVTPTADPEDPPETTTWEYKVVAYQDAGGDAQDTVPSPVGSTSVGAATLDGSTSYNTVGWTPVDGADGYRILRKGPGDSAFGLLGSVAGQAAATFQDDGDATEAYDAATAEPQRVPCPVESVDGVTLEFTVQQGEVSATAGCVTVPGIAPCVGHDAAGNPVRKIPLDIGIPGLALEAGPSDDPESNGIDYGIGYALHFKVGLSKQKGFFVNTHDGWGPDDEAGPELQVGLGFDLPASMLAELAFLNIHIDKATGPGHDPSKKLFAGAFQIDLKSDASDASCWDGTGPACAPDDAKVLTFADLGDRDIGDLFGISLAGGFNIDWNVVADADSALPGVRANFQLEWAFDNQDPEAFGAPYIAFKNVGINAGSFFQGLLGPIVKEVKRVTGPIQPVMDTLYAPIPVLTELSQMAGGDAVTLVTLAKTFNTLADGPSLEFVDTIKAVVEFINRLPDCVTECFVPLGDFEVLGAKALETSSTPTSGDSLIDKSPGSFNPQTAESVKSALNTKNTASSEPVFSAGATKGDAEKSGFTFPIIDNPASAFALLMGDDIALVEFDSGPLTLGFSWRQSFGPVYAPPPVMITLSGSASVTLRFMAGLDTAGVRHAVEAARAGTSVDAVKLLDGLYFKTVDNDGNPVPVVRLDGQIAAGAAVTALIITVGIEGGLALTIGFFWNDPNDDGKFRVSEFLQAAINNPLCLFTTSGRLSLFLKLYITLGFSPFAVSFDFTLADFTLLDFTAQPDCTPPPPKLGGTTNDTLVVYAGDFGKDSNRGAPWGNGTADYEEDVVKVTALHFAQRPGDLQGANPDFDGFAVNMLGERREYLDPGLQRVVVDGSSYNRPMIITFAGDGKKEGETPLATDGPGDDLSAFDKDAVVIGGSGNDTIQTGTGLSYVDGRGGSDTIITADKGGPTSRAWVAGGDGNDTISTGHGDNHVAGDGSLGNETRTVSVTHNATDGGGSAELSGIFDWTKIADPTATDSGAGDDTIGVGLGTNTVNGNGGDDTLGVAADAPDGDGGTRTAGDNTLVGGNGVDRIQGGSGDDDIFTGTQGTFGVDAEGPADTGGRNVVDTGTGNDEVWGSRSEDHVSSHSATDQQAMIIGGGGHDALIGGYGTDEVYGGPGDDYVVAEPAKVGERTGTDDVVDGVSFGETRPVEKLPLPDGTTPSAKTLVGGLGNDHVLGGDGRSTIFGDRYLAEAGADDETCRPGAPVTSDPVPESTSGGPGADGNDLILGGSGVDTVSAGGGDDRASTHGDLDLLCGQEGDDVLLGGPGGDMLWGGTGDDRGYGETGVDHVFGNDGEDVLYGQSDPDVLEGNDGADKAFGGTGNDLVYGGTRAEGREDDHPAGDDLYGDAGDDRLVGDNGTVDVIGDASDDPAVPFDLDGTPATAGSGDRIHGGAGDDTAYGGLGDDIVNGNDGDDHLEGNNHSDTIHGNDGEDHVVGGSFQETEAGSGVGRADTGDHLYGDAGPDLLVGDNAILELVSGDAEATPVTLRRGFALDHKVTLLDLGDNPTGGTSGHDEMSGGDGEDVLYGQGGDDRIKGNAEDDYAEGGPGVDWVEGNTGDDDLVGGSSSPLDTMASPAADAMTGQPDAADALFGGPGDDVAIGDNGRMLRPAASETPTRATVRLGGDGENDMTPRIVDRWDRNADGDGGYLTVPDDTRFGADQVSGGDGVDALWGQDGDDALSGGGHDDYVEGNGGRDLIRGDLALDSTQGNVDAVPVMTNGSWVGSATTPASARDGGSGLHGQDDLIGGTSTAAFRDGGDTIEGNGADDVLLGDNGTLVRTLQGDPGARTEQVYVDRYPDGATPADATVSRTHDPDLGAVSTRFCTEQQDTCDEAGAFGDDTLYGDAGDDGIWAQDGDDRLYGGDQDDDMFGELGDDTMFGGAGEDAMLGDRGGVVNQLLDDDDNPAELTISLTQPPAETYTGFRRGLYDRRVDLLHDVDGDRWIGDSDGAAMPHDGITVGGRDKIRGGPDADNIHAGYGDDLANGDSGGDQVFGGDGEDVLWGGKGCDPVLDATKPECRVDTDGDGVGDGAFDASARGTDDRMVDHLFGGAGESDPTEQDLLGSDVLDFNPRGSYETPGTTCTLDEWPADVGDGTVDPCLWFEMTDKDDADPSDNQHHHGTDWIYGGWDRDVMQGNVTANGPNPGDRLIDWNGAYNLYTHCNAAYGGFNDIRLHAPDLHTFLTGLAWASGAGRDASDVTTEGTSAHRELAFTYTRDQKDHGVGKAYPDTPGHFDEPSCEE